VGVLSTFAPGFTSRLPWVYVSVFMPKADSFDYCSFENILKSGSVICLLWLEYEMSTTGACM
jgi:hypothetical protein